jgi:hypothetical protein
MKIGSSTGDWSKHPRPQDNVFNTSALVDMNFRLADNFIAGDYHCRRRFR